MDTKLSDNTPVQLNYHSAPMPLYTELKAHTEELYNEGWIVNSKPSYSSAVVSVRKDGSLRLYCHGSTIGVRRVRTYAYFYWRTHDFGHVYVDRYAHFYL